jgi:hypothetical protein
MNTPQNDGGAAFPESASGPYPNGEIVPGRSGMTLRDYFAGQAMQSENITIAIMVASGKTAVPDNWNYDVAKGAYSIADAMLAERNQ